MRLKEYISEIQNKGENMRPLCITIFPSNKCSCKCKMCSIRGSDFLDFNILINLIEQADNMGVESIVFTGGGEPTLHPNFIDIIDFIEKNTNIRVGILTNGVSPVNYARISDYSCIRFIRFSIDAVTPELYKNIRGVDFISVNNSLKSVLRRNPQKTRINSLIMKYNINDIRNIINYAVDNKTNIHFQIAIDTNELKNEISLFEFKKIVKLFDYHQENHDLKEAFLEGTEINLEDINTCIIPMLYLILDAKGNFYPCVYGSNNLGQNKKDLKLGNVYNTDLKEFWEKTKKQRYELFKRPHKNEICKKCIKGGIYVCSLHLEVKKQYEELEKNYRKLFL